MESKNRMLPSHRGWGTLISLVRQAKKEQKPIDFCNKCSRDYPVESFRTVLCILRKRFPKIDRKQFLKDCRNVNILCSCGFVQTHKKPRLIGQRNYNTSFYSLGD